MCGSRVRISQGAPNKNNSMITNLYLSQTLCKINKETEVIQYSIEDQAGNELMTTYLKDVAACCLEALKKKYNV